MLKKIKGNNNLILLSAMLLFTLSLYLHLNSSRPVILISKQDSSINLNHHFLNIISFGNKRLVADILWIQTLLESDLEKYKKRDLNSWMYLRFKSISELDPKFYENYLYGGMFLSIIKDDLEGAAEIYERGLSRFPNDFKLNYNAGFNYYFEMNDLEKGLPLLEKAQSHPQSPPLLKFIVNKLRFQKGHDFDSAIAFIKYNLETNEDPVLEHKLEMDLYALKAEKDLKCLNEGRNDCSFLDAEGRPYLKLDGVWTASKNFTPYRIHRPKK